MGDGSWWTDSWGRSAPGLILFGKNAEHAATTGWVETISLCPHTVSTLGDLLRGVSTGSIWVRGLQRDAATRRSNDTNRSLPLHLLLRLEIISLVAVLATIPHLIRAPFTGSWDAQHWTGIVITSKFRLKLLDTSAIYHPLMEFQMGVHLLCCRGSWYKWHQGSVDSRASISAKTIEFKGMIVQPCDLSFKQ